MDNEEEEWKHKAKRRVIAPALVHVAAISQLLVLGGRVQEEREQWQQIRFLQPGFLTA